MSIEDVKLRIKREREEKERKKTLELKEFNRRAQEVRVRAGNMDEEIVALFSRIFKAVGLNFHIVTRNLDLPEWAFGYEYIRKNDIGWFGIDRSRATKNMWIEFEVRYSNDQFYVTFRPVPGGAQWFDDFNSIQELKSLEDCMFELLYKSESRTGNGRY